MKYPGNIPGIPTGNNSYPEYPNQWLAYPEVPESLTWHDLCMKEGDLSISLWPEGVEVPDVCKRSPENCEIKPDVVRRCKTTQWPLDFVYDYAREDYDLQTYRTDEELVRKVRTGKGDESNERYQGLGQNLFIQLIFGGTTPRRVEQDFIFGPNDLTAARACRFVMEMNGQAKAQGYTRMWIERDFMIWLTNEVDAWGQTSEYITTRAFNGEVWEADLLGTLGEEIGIMMIALLLIYAYSCLVLGNCSPVHLRVVSAMVGLCCVGLSVTAGYGLASALGYKFSRFHSLLPFLILGVGVDDMFVIVNTIDQTPDHLSPTERFRLGMGHAGPSVTITSLTGGLSFFIGAVAEAAALASFCFFAGCCVAFLYISFLTLFAPWFLEDMRRLHLRKGECFGLCCCKEDSIWCCKGQLLSVRLRKFSHIATVEEEQDTREEYASKVEEFMTNVLATEVLSQQGRVCILLVWVIAAAVGLYGASKVTPNFSLEFFLIPGKPVTKFMEMNALHFKEGYSFEIYSVVDDVDIASVESQEAILDLNDRVGRCYLCEEQWLKDQILWRLWYQDYNDWVRRGECLYLPGGLRPFERTIPPELFYICLAQALQEGGCKGCTEGLTMSSESDPRARRILMMKD